MAHSRNFRFNRKAAQASFRRATRTPIYEMGSTTPVAYVSEKEGGPMGFRSGGRFNPARGFHEEDWEEDEVSDEDFEAYRKALLKKIEQEKPKRFRGTTGTGARWKRERGDDFGPS